MFDALEPAKLRTKIHEPDYWTAMYSTRTFPSAISHRGLRTAAPENTVAAFLAAVGAGAEGIELDAHATSDGVVFVHHDFEFRMDRDESATVAFKTASSADVRKARLAGDHPIPTLDEVIESVPVSVRLYIEVKPAGIEGDVIRCLRRHEDRIDSIAIHSFDHRIVKRMFELMPSLRTGILQVAYPIDSREAMRAAGASDLWQHAEYIDSLLTADVHAAGGHIIAWTPNDRSQWQRLADLGVDGICTDHVDEYLAWRREAEEDAP